LDFPEYLPARSSLRPPDVKLAASMDRLRSGRLRWRFREYRDVSAGWLLPAVSCSLGGLVTDASLIAGAGGAGVNHQTIVLAGLAGLVAGASSMASGEYISVTMRNDLSRAEAEPGELPSPYISAVASFVSFAFGALIPLSPYLAGFSGLGVALVMAGIAALAGGAVVARLSERPLTMGCLRQFAAAFLATGMAFAFGHLAGALIR
jgi:VIT1/CCC1 family predicted Fe2+/Mn2+ transporter